MFQFIQHRCGPVLAWGMLSIGLVGGLAGCQDAPVQATVIDGSVTVDGQPLTAAVVTFEPLRGTTGPSASSPIFGGQFSVDRDAKLHGGTYLARVKMIPASLRRGLPDDQLASLPSDDVMIDRRYDSDSQMNIELVPNQTNQVELEVEFQK